MNDKEKLLKILEIQEKCNQYMNEYEIDPVEVHAILEFIHTRAIDLKNDIL
ncbi:MAG: hypothetical protein QQN63_04690 [Nitrosopumilus sp.]